MQFKIVATLFLASVASAADIIGWTGSGCGGTSLACRGIQENICCNFNMNVRSVRWTLPASSRGIGYAGNSCRSTSSTPVQGAKSAACFNYAWNLRSAKWILGSGSRRRAVVARAAEDDECQKPNEYSYYSENKKQMVTKKIPAENADEVLKWIEDGEWVKIEGLEEVAEGQDL
ncbi:hypothetical protein BZA05DRAFT_469960 [Tricharina praecox]|uniref:uncharacterized protein n=1 Tax=Tricharina praecox TaxID=43433 RepID=UPI002220E463|nr:uncharacterized protein BZA05DRAFT_469960 [Tricharina praecox]KAI5858697.1 hypothetical protein BZA05DRAFT_469960 [Tricharina praecox]